MSEKTARGQNIKVVSYRQADFDVAPPTPNGLQWPIVSCGLRMTRGRVGDPMLTADRNATRTAPGRKMIGGPIVTRPDSRWAGFLMQDMVGGVPVSAAPVGGITVHTAKVGELPIGNCIDVQSTDLTGVGSVLRYIGCRCNEWSFGTSDEGFLQISMNHSGIDSVQDDELLDAAPKLYVSKGFDMAGLIFEEGGTEIKIAKDYQLTVSNNLDEESGRVIGTGGAKVELPEGKIGVSFSYNALFRNFTLLNKARNNQLSSHAIKLTSSVTGHYFKVTLNEIEYELEEPIAEGPNGRTVPMKGTAILDAHVAASSIILECANDVPDLTTIPA